MSSMTTRNDKAQRILEFLKKELHIPDGVIRFKVVFDVDCVITVEGMDYAPSDSDKDNA